MKKIIVGLTLLSSLSVFAADLETFFLSSADLEPFSLYYAVAGKCKERSSENFKLNKSNLLVVAANVCSAYSNLKVEQRAYAYYNGATLFHDFSIQETENVFKLHGSCANVPDFKKSKIIEKSPITITVNKRDYKQGLSEQSKFIIKGKIGKKSLEISIVENIFYSPNCYRDVSNVGLKQITIGTGIFDILSDRKTNFPMDRRDKAEWNQFNNRISFYAHKLSYGGRQWNGRPLSFLTQAGKSSTHLLVKSGNMLHYEDGSKNFSFANNKTANNVYYYSNNSLQGCTSLVMESELGEPEFLTVMQCKILRKRFFEATSAPENGIETMPPETNIATPTKEEIAKENLAKLISEFIKDKRPVLKAHRFCKEYNTYSDYCKNWTRTDIQLGYIVIDRKVKIISISEFKIIETHFLQGGKTLQYSINGSLDDKTGKLILNFD